jgi:hypothetical protein
MLARSRIICFSYFNFAARVNPKVHEDLHSEGSMTDRGLIVGISREVIGPEAEKNADVC